MSLNLSESALTPKTLVYDVVKLITIFYNISNLNQGSGEFYENKNTKFENNVWKSPFKGFSEQ